MKNGFTLAEVLITLGIIGAVAAMTIPILMNSTQEQEFKTGYRKAYSVISQALQRANADNTLTPFSGTNGGLGLQANFQTLQQYFSVAKTCDTTHLSDCWDMLSTSDSFRYETSDVLSFVDKSGMAWRARTHDADSSVPMLLVDINGNKKPNKYGQDRFPFYFSNSGNAYSNGYIIHGIPTKIIPELDKIDNSDLECPSYSTHLCYYNSWLFN